MILSEILQSYYPYPYIDWFQPFPFSTTNIRDYDVFIRDYAKSLLEMTNRNSVAHLLCLYYGGKRETLLGELRNGVYGGTCFQARYDETIAQVKQRLNSSKLHWSLNLGMWQPLGNADILGPKLEFGGEAGYRGKCLGFDLTALLRVLRSREEYVIKHDNNLITTNHFFGGFFGGSLIYQLIKPGPLGLETFAGVGYDFIEAYREKDDFENLNAFNMNLGLNIQFPLNKMKARYMGVQARYNIVGYYTHGGTDLTGNTLSLNLVYGYLGNPMAISEARRLHYYD